MLHVLVFLFVHERVKQEGATVDCFGFGGRGGECFQGAGLRVGGHVNYFQRGAEAE